MRFPSFQTCRCVSEDSTEGRKEGCAPPLESELPQLVGGRGSPLPAVSIDFFQAMDVLALEMPFCKSGATSPSSLNTVKNKKTRTHTGVCKKWPVLSLNYFNVHTEQETSPHSFLVHRRASNARVIAFHGIARSAWWAPSEMNNAMSEHRLEPW